MNPSHGDAEIAQLIESLGQGSKVMLIQVDGAEIKEKLTQTLDESRFTEKLMDTDVIQLKAPEKLRGVKPRTPLYAVAQDPA